MPAFTFTINAQPVPQLPNIRAQRVQSEFVNKWRALDGTLLVDVFDVGDRVRYILSYDMTDKSTLDFWETYIDSGSYAVVYTTSSLSFSGNYWVSSSNYTPMGNGRAKIEIILDPA